MTRPQVSFDITRLVTRILNSTPNGIDRLDIAYALHFLSNERAAPALMHLGPLGHRTFPVSNAAKAVLEIKNHLGEKDDFGGRHQLKEIRAWLDGAKQKPGSGASASQAVQHRKLSPGKAAGYLKVAAFHLAQVGFSGKPVETSLPQNCRYLCVSQYPLSVPDAYSWLRRRQDVKAVFFVHDLLPLQFPEYFKPSEYERHGRRMQNLAEHASAALVSTQAVAHELRDEMAKRGRPSLQIHVSPVPLASAFSARESIAATSHKYFVMCGTIEPRKNHLMLLQVWRELALLLKDATPKLLLIGARGWENENVLDLLDRSPAMREHVLEINGLSTSELSVLMRGAQALLMPSFGEGYGLPVAEALATGLPVIASDIAVFHEIAGNGFVPVSPLDGPGWLKAIGDALCGRFPVRSDATRPSGGRPQMNDLEAFLDEL